MSSKLIGSESKHFAELVIDAVQLVKSSNYLGEFYYPIKSINILKAHGQGSIQSELVKGYAI